MGAATSSKASTSEHCHGFSRSYYAERQDISKGKGGSEKNSNGNWPLQRRYRILRKKYIEKISPEKLLLYLIYQIIIRTPCSSTNRYPRKEQERRRSAKKRTSHTRTGKHRRSRKVGRTHPSSSCLSPTCYIHGCSSFAMTWETRRREGRVQREAARGRRKKEEGGIRTTMAGPRPLPSGAK